MSRKRIGQAEIEASYDVAKCWFSGKLSRTEAKTKLVEEHGLNPVSAGDLLQALHAIMRGERFTRSISAAAAEYYVHVIMRDYGNEAARRAIVALERHVDYYETVQPSKMLKMRALLSKLREATSKADLIAEHIAFDREVAAMMLLPKEQRYKQLPQAGHKPRSIIVQHRAFIRSKAVVAEVLLRASGICESCKGAAPFLRKATGLPYLEVHHRITLADGGDDTVENAIALCPNCHRKMHHG